MINIRKLESELWESADLLRSGSPLTSNQYCMPVLGLIFLRYAYSRFKLVEAEILKDRPSRGGRVMPVEASDFTAKSALFLPKEAQYDYLLNLPDDISSTELKNKDGHTMRSLGEVVNNAMSLIEEQSEQLVGILPKSYTDFADGILSELLRIFNNSALDEVGGDIIGRIYEYFLNKFAKSIASDDGMFFTPKSLVKMIVNILEPKSGILLDPACGSGGMFIQSGDFVNEAGMNANSTMTFYGQEKTPYNAQLCLMNMAVHGLTGVIKAGESANTFYHDAHNLDGRCDYVMANPPFNLSNWGQEKLKDDVRWKYGLPPAGNANYAWIQHMIHHLAPNGKIGLVLANGALSSQTSGEGDIRKNIIEADLVEGIVALPTQLFYSVTIPVTLWFISMNKKQKGKTLFVDARNMGYMVNRKHRDFTDEDIQRLADTFSSFQDGTLEDVKGFCAVVNTKKIEEQDYILTPGRYVGIEVIEEDEEPFDEKMNRLTSELSEMFKKSHELEKEIRGKLGAIGYEI